MTIPTDQIIFKISKDKLLTYALVVLLIITIVTGYYVVIGKNKTAANSNTATDPMADHHGGGNKKFEPLNPGATAPDFDLMSTNGQTISLSDYRGKNVFLFFNEGVMCSPCWQEISRLEKFKEDFASLNTVIIPVSVDDQATWDPILKEERITTPILIDSERRVTKAYKALGTPSSMHDDRAGHTYIHVDPQGIIHSSSDFPEMNVPSNLLLQHIQQYQDAKTQS